MTIIRHLNPRTRQGGFTLIELLVVIVIIALLMAIALPSYLNQQTTAKDSAAKQYLTVAHKNARSEKITTDGSYPAAGALVSALAESEPGLSFEVGDVTNATTLKKIIVERLSDSQIRLHTLSASNNIVTLDEDASGQQSFAITAAAPAGVSYAVAVLADSPVAYWRQNDTGLVAADELGTHPGTIGANITSAAGALFGDSDLALSFPGASSGGDGQIVIPDANDLDLTNGFTVEAWFKPGAATGSSFTILGKQGAYALTLTTDDELRFTVGNTQISNAFGLITRGAWNHVVIVFDGSNMALHYTAGVLRSSFGGAGSCPVTASDLMIGAANSFGNSPFAGEIDEVAIYPTELSAARILAHYEAGTT